MLVQEFRTMLVEAKKGRRREEKGEKSLRCRWDHGNPAIPGPTIIPHQ